ncbi:MAG: glycoside hydrolase family 5 protein [Chloroflexota bacterium]
MKPFFLLAVVFLLVFACAPTPAQTPPGLPPSSTNTAAPSVIPPPADSVALSRGVNLGNMLEAPTEGEWGLFVQEEYFDLIQDAGFDFVRLPVRWNTHAEADWPYTIDPAFFARVDEVVNWALERDLTIIVDFHHYEEMAWDPWSHKDRFLGIWEQVAEHYKDYPPTVLFELLNEPNDQLDAALWNGYVSEALAIVRETNPTREVVIGPVWWNAYDWVSTLDVPDDGHIIVTFHYYLPFEFTHQGAEWAGDEAAGWLGTTWGSEADKAELVSRFDLVAAWAKRKNVRILLGEFGVYHRADMTERARWTAFVREQAEARGFAWAYWEFGSGFGAYDPEAREWREELLRALIP